MDNSRIRSIQRIGPHHPYVLSIIYGTLLGDSHAERRSYPTLKGIKKGGTRISFQQENSNMEYIMWLWKTLYRYGYCNKRKPKVRIRICKGGRRRFVIRFHTWTYNSFNIIHDSFYLKEKKRIPYNIDRFLTPLALACWFMDDGCKIHNTVKFATNSFLHSDLEFMQKILINKYGIYTSIHSAGVPDQYVLYIKTNSMSKFKKVVEPFMVESMKYKLGI